MAVLSRAQAMAIIRKHIENISTEKLRVIAGKVLLIEQEEKRNHIVKWTLENLEEIRAERSKNE